MTALVELQNAGVQFAADGRSRAGWRLGAMAALQQITLAIEAGERIAVVGANGSGKSTLLRLLHGLLQAGQGSVRSPDGVQQAMLFQRPHMLRMRVSADIARTHQRSGLRVLVEHHARRDARVGAHASTNNGNFANLVINLKVAETEL
jgi:ATPase subunit of ABC transporter with duplicated ATPase domains